MTGCWKSSLPQPPQVFCKTRVCVENCCLPIHVLSFSLAPYFLSVWFVWIFFIWFSFTLSSSVFIVFSLGNLIFLNSILSPYLICFPPSILIPLCKLSSPPTSVFLVLPSYSSLAFFLTLLSFLLLLSEDSLPLAFSCRLGSVILFMNADYLGWSSMSITPAE